MEKKFSAGFAQVDITPDFPCSLTGYGNDPVRIHETVLDHIFMSCTSFTDEQDNTILMIAADLLCAYDPVADEIRKQVSEATGVPFDQIFLGASHTHSAPTMHVKWVPSAQPFVDLLIPRTVACCVESMANRKPAQLYLGSVETKKLNYVKHYAAKHRETGEIDFVGDQFGILTGKFMLGHATQADETMYVLRIAREGDKDIAIVNWRGHPHFTCSYTAKELSSDYIGFFREELEQLTGAHAVYFQGACGNLNTWTRIKREGPVYANRRDMLIPFSKKLAEYAYKGYQIAEEIPTGPIRTKHLVFKARVNHAQDHLIEQAKEVSKHWYATYDDGENRKLANSLGLRSHLQAGAIKRNFDRGETTDLPVNAMAIGDTLGMVTFPGELFDIISVGVENQSPFDTTLMIGYCNHAMGYLPAAVTYEYTSYETDTTPYAQGVGEELMHEYVKMLEEIK